MESLAPHASRQPVPFPSPLPIPQNGFRWSAQRFCFKEARAMVRRTVLLGLTIASWASSLSLSLFLSLYLSLYICIYQYLSIFLYLSLSLSLFHHLYLYAYLCLCLCTPAGLCAHVLDDRPPLVHTVRAFIFFSGSAVADHLLFVHDLVLVAAGHSICDFVGLEDAPVFCVPSSD